MLGPKINIHTQCKSARFALPCFLFCQVINILLIFTPAIAARINSALSHYQFQIFYKTHAETACGSIFFFEIA